MNEQNIVVRILLYIFTSFVFSVTLVIDAVLFNTIDFWKGEVSANDYRFEEGGKRYAVTHYYKGKQKLRNTEIRIFDTDGQGEIKPEHVIHLSETKSGQIQVFENGELKAQVDDIYNLPQFTRIEEGKKQPIRDTHLPMVTAARSM